MKNLKYVAFVIALITMVLAVVARLFLPEKVLFGLAALTYLRLTITMLLFSLAFHFLFNSINCLPVVVSMTVCFLQSQVLQGSSPLQRGN